MRAYEKGNNSTQNARSHGSQAASLAEGGKRRWRIVPTFTGLINLFDSEDLDQVGFFFLRFERTVYSFSK